MAMETSKDIGGGLACQVRDAAAFLGESSSAPTRSTGRYSCQPWLPHLCDLRAWDDLASDGHCDWLVRLLWSSFDHNVSGPCCHVLLLNPSPHLCQLIAEVCVLGHELCPEILLQPYSVFLSVNAVFFSAAAMCASTYAAFSLILNMFCHHLIQHLSELTFHSMLVF